MNCIVTAGPTYEELDEVRRLTNFSTGALGTELANYLAAHGHHVELLRGHYSTATVSIKGPNCNVFTTTEDLHCRLEKLSNQKWQAIFHAAAVSDFGFGKIWRQRPDGQLEEARAAKLSTRDGTLLAELRPTPKILARLREWFPTAFIAGWKYELDGRREQAIARAEDQLNTNHIDACILNGRAYGQGFGLITASGQCRHAPDKPALFAALTQLLPA